MSFDDLDLDPALRRGIDSLGFTEPTPKQRSALPPALTGSGRLVDSVAHRLLVAAAPPLGVSAGTGGDHTDVLLYR